MVVTVVQKGGGRLQKNKNKKKNNKRKELTMDEMMEASMSDNDNGMKIELSDIYTGGEECGSGEEPPNHKRDKRGKSSSPPKRVRMGEWDKIYDEASQSYYYMHKATGHSQWENPL